MIKLSKAHLAQLREFGRYLDHIGYADCYNSYRYMPYKYMQCIEFLRRIRSIVPHGLRVAIRLFSLGETVEASEVKRTELRRFLRVLTHVHVLHEDEGGYFLRTENLQCQVVDGAYLFVSGPRFTKESVANFGDDSIKLTRHLVGCPGQRGLDVCCGSGIQSILLARRGLKVMGLDIQEDVLNLAQVNSAVNGVDHLTSFIHSDIHEYEAKNAFDIIVSNPPLLPIPRDLNYSILGDGGESGLDICSEIIHKLKDLMSPKGCAIIIGSCAGTESTWGIVSLLEKSDVSPRLSSKVFLCNRIEMARYQEMAALTSTMQYGESFSKGLALFRKMFKNVGADYIYTFLLKLTLVEEDPRVIIIPLYQKAKGDLWYSY